MASSGINRFKWFIFLCLVVGGFLIWNKVASFGKKKPDPQILPTEIKPESKEEVKPLPPIRGVLTPEELDTFFSLTTNQRAGCMHDRNYAKREEKNSLVYSFITNPKLEGYYGYVKIFTNQETYEIGFNKNEDYYIFRNQFKNLKKLSPSGDCIDRYELSGNCIACDMGFIEDANSYKVKIMPKLEIRTPSKSETKLEKKGREKIEQGTIKSSNPLLNGARIPQPETTKRSRAPVTKN